MFIQSHLSQGGQGEHERGRKLRRLRWFPPSAKKSFPKEAVFALLSLENRHSAQIQSANFVQNNGETEKEKKFRKKFKKTIDKRKRKWYNTKAAQEWRKTGRKRSRRSLKIEQ